MKSHTQHNSQVVSYELEASIFSWEIAQGKQ
jgi:hypothetical protein